MRIKRLKKTVGYLGRLLGETIAELSGEKTFKIEEELRKLSLSSRRGDPEAVKKSERLIRSQDAERLYDLTLAFNMFFELTNLAEENHRISLLKQRGREFQAGGAALRESLVAGLKEFKAAKVKPKDVQAAINDLRIELVFTAHPTESKRKTILSKLKEIGELLPKDLQQDPADFVNERRLREILSSLWLTDRARPDRPSVLEEVSRGLWFFDHGLYGVMAELQERVERSLQRVYPDLDAPEPGWLRFASWIGGDRDGHPYVTPEVTKETIRLQNELAIRKIREFLKESAQDLTVASWREPDFKEVSDFNAEEDEPLRSTIEDLESRLEHLNVDEVKSQVAGILEFLSDKPADACSHKLRRLQNALEIFGDSLLPLDLRQDSEVHEALTAEILKEADYARLEEAKKIEILEAVMNDREINRLRRKLDFVDANLKEKVIRPLEIFRDQDRLGKSGVIGNYIISMTEGVSDVLEVMLFQKLVGVAIPIVPLFETRADLEAAPEVLREIFRSPIYKERLEKSRYKQMVMLGYSDSNKDCGYATASWTLYYAQREILKVAKDFGVAIEFFHGRGGTIARGGGRAADAILAQPEGLESGRIRITEQGEVLSTRYQVPEIAKRVLEQVTYGSLKAIVKARSSKETAFELYTEEMTCLSKAAEARYREFFHERPEVIEFWQDVTPLDQIARLNIGSRPSFRKKMKSLRDVRAIPWVFSWSQSRFCLPGWYGLGSGLEAAKDRFSLNKFKTMYREWSFFQTLIDNAQLTLSKTDLSIAERYLSLSRDKKMAKKLFEEIKTEFQKTKTLVNKVSGQRQLLEREPVLKRSVELRNPYIDPMNAIQIECLKRLRGLKKMKPSDQEATERCVALTISGISGGLKNTG